MPPIDDKIVAMSFENSKFEHGVSQTLSSLDKLKAALHFPGASKGLSDLDASAKKVDLSHIGQGVDEIQSKLGALRLTAIAVFAQLASKAISAGTSFAKAFTIGPAKAGFQEYTTNLNAVQTILANTQASGAGLKEVNAALDELNTYSDKTIYNFSQMARNIGTFTAAGVDLKTATASIKGIANLAALSGSNSEQASTAMYQLSQAIASGSVKLMDWNSVVNAGMGGTVFQRALAMTAEKMGTLKKGTVSLVGPMKNVKIAGESFRNSLSAPGKDGWLTSKVLTETLQMLTSDLTDAELRAKGWNETQIKAIQQQAKTAMLAATTVKTLTGVMDVAKETAGSGWAKTWQIVFGDFEEAKVTFTSLSNAINGILIDSARARNNLLSDWKELGGRTAAIDAIKSAFKSLGQILQPIKEAFRSFFPPKTASDLMYLTQQFEALVEKMKPSQITLFHIRQTFRGLFAVLDIGFEIIKGVVGVFADLIGSTKAGSGSFLSFTANVGNALVRFHEWLIEGGRLASFFKNLTRILKAPIDLLRAISTAVQDLFAGFSPGDFFGQVDKAGKKLSPLAAIFEGIADAWGWFLDVISGSGKVLRPALDAILELFSGLGDAINGAGENINFDAILQVIQTGFFAGIFLMFKRFLGKGSIIDQLMGRTGIFSGGGIFGQLENTMKSLQTNLKAKTLKEIAIAIGILALSVVALSLVNPEDLKKSLTAITVMFGQLLAAMAIIDKIGMSAGFLKMPFITGALILLAGAIDMLAIAVIALSFLSWEELAKGLGGVAVLLGGIVLAVKPLSAGSMGMIKAGVGIAAIAASLLILSAAVRIMGTMKLQELGKGLGGIAAGLILMTFAMQNMPAVPLKSTVGLMAMASALLILATAVRTMGSMDLRSLAKGLGGMAAGLILMTFAMQNLPAKSMLRNAIALIAMAGAVRLLAESIGIMGGMSVKELAKGLIGLGGGLAIMAGALYLMGGALPGAVALGVASAGIAVLAPALVALGRQSWGQILKSMVALAVALGVLAGAALLITPAIPSMIGLGAALLLIGAGLALAGIGIAAVAWAIAALIVALPAGVGILIAALVELQQGIIDNVKLLILGLLEIVRAFAATAPKFVDALVKILGSLVDGLIKIMPKLKVAIQTIIDAALSLLADNQGKLIQAGFNLILGLLIGIRNNIGPFVTVIVSIITKFLSALSSNMNRIITAGTKLLTSFIAGIVRNISNVVTTVATIITKFVTAIGANINRIVTAGANILVKFLQGLQRNIGNVIKAGTDLIVSIIKGLSKAQERILNAGVDAIKKFIAGLSSKAVELADAAFKAILDFLNGLTDAVTLYAPQIRAATGRLGFAIIDGISFGMLSKAEGLYKSARGVATKVIGFMSGPFREGSPSKTMMLLGANIIMGLTNGVKDTAPKAYAAAEGMSNGLINTVRSIFKIASPSQVMYEIGKAIGQGFSQGIRGSADDVRNAFLELNTKLTEEMRNARIAIGEEEDKLAALLKEKKEKLAEVNKETFKKEGEKAKALAKVQKQYAEPIAEAQKAITVNQELLKKSTALHNLMIKSFKDERKELIDLAGQFEALTTKLEEAESELNNLITTKEAARKSFEDQYKSKPEISGPMTEELASARAKIEEEKAKLKAAMEAKTVDPAKVAEANAAIVDAQAKLDELTKDKVLTEDGTQVDPLATYLLALNNQALAVDTYAATLEQLRKLGLDHETYKMLVEGGTADQDFATALLKGGKGAVGGLNKLDAKLETASKKLAKNASDYLHDAGIASQEGLIAGLKKDRGKIRQEMEAIAREMLAALRKELRSKSPSQAFAEIGSYSMQGLALGFSRSKKVVVKAVEGAAEDALNAMKKSMAAVSQAVTDELNPNPVITPILDLTVVKSQASELAALTAAESLGQASAISSAQIAAEAEAVLAAGGSSIKFEQNNYSPKALTDIEIYRNTRNQLSQLKSVLAT